MNTPMQPQWEKKSRFLTQLLIWSGALNIGLSFSLGYLFFQYRIDHVDFQLRPAAYSLDPISLTNEKIFFQFLHQSWDELIQELDSLHLLEDGYRRRDIALAVLTSFHGLDIERALPEVSLQKRKLIFTQEDAKKVSCFMYPGLTEDQFHAVKYFIKTEEFPFTPKRLFWQIQNAQHPLQDTLLEAFYLTPEFTFLHTLLMRSGIHSPKNITVQMMKEGDWDMIHTLTEKQKMELDLSKEHLQSLLLSYVKKQSRAAAKMLLQWDLDFVVKRLGDEELMQFIDLLEHSSSLEKLLKELITSPRSDALWKKSGERLYQLRGLALPEVYDHQVTLETFIPLEKKSLDTSSLPSLSLPAQVSHAKKTFEYVIQEGDNLWKIARRHHISIDDIYLLNHLESDKLRTGKILILPKKG
ncbi:LysM peptidoglycan-binding domain-containing protein [Rhabdochlamydiaceae symbiont of Dictyostelium giganteum]|uniref:LysM peptidoglycan-binding domain-containing protein n=1 Tax=Rhabdochlamydiaceae symbiont of Dictyostelium giganteum TaxID=3342349 RepID=UPI00384FD543